MKRNIISVLFIVIGVSLMLSSVGIKLYSKYKEKNFIEEFNKDIIIENNHKQKNKSVIYTNKDGDKIAIMEIPSIHVKSIIVEGTNMHDLRYYLGHFNNTAMPGMDGNFCIAGHSSTIYNEILNDLHKVNINDEIKIRTLTDEYKYIITKKFVVEPTNIDVLKSEENKKNMTIVTCTEQGKKRLIVKSELQS